MDLTQKLLCYWYNLEFFSPFWPERTKDTTYVSSENKKLIWLTKADSKYTYDVYLGKIKSQDLIVEMLEAVGEKDDIIPSLTIENYKKLEDPVFTRCSSFFAF